MGQRLDSNEEYSWKISTNSDESRLTLRTKTLITFIVPFQNFEILIKNMNRSFQQHHSSHEVVFVHDSKIPLDRKQIKQLTNPRGNRKYVYGEFNGPGAARNRGLEEASGEWIVFWDSDDFGYPAKILELLNGEGEFSVVANFCVSHVGREDSSLIYNFEVNETQIASNPGLWRFIFQMRSIKGVRFRELKLGEDILFLLESGILEKELRFAQEIIYEYRISPSQSTRNMDVVSKLEEFIFELSEYIKHFNPANPVTYAIYWRQIFSLIGRSYAKKIAFCGFLTFELFKSIPQKNRFMFLRSISMACKKGLF